LFTLILSAGITLKRTRVKKLLENRHWLGMALGLGGAGLMLVHFIDYGFTLHLTAVDHGTVGLILIILGAFLGAGKAGARRRTKPDD